MTPLSRRRTFSKRDCRHEGLRCLSRCRGELREAARSSLGISCPKRLLLKMLLLVVTLPAVAADIYKSSQVLPGCPQDCGNGVLIPYPFGIFVGCSRDRSFNLQCMNNKPYITASWPLHYSYEVTEISFQTNEIKILTQAEPICNDSKVVNFGFLDTPLFIYFSHAKNKLTAVGCNAFGALAYQEPNRRAALGCLATCENSTDKLLADDSCSGFGCCQTSIPSGLTDGINLTLSKISNNTLRWLWDGADDNDESRSCGYVFLVEAASYTFKKSLLSRRGIQTFPVVLDWIVGYQTCEHAQKVSNYACKSNNSVCYNSSHGTGYTCNCSQGYQGNPYLENGCQDIDECLDPQKYPCQGKCINTPGSYFCKPRRPRLKLSASNLAVIVVFLFSIAIGIWIYSIIQKRKFDKRKESYFRQNGGLILQSKISSNVEIQTSLKVFTKEEIDKATNKFSQNHVIGQGGQGVVFKGKLPNDDREFAIKKSILLDGSRVEEFINEIVILSQINHKNVVRLIGCCLEVEQPLLVYEYIPNGTLSYHIHQQCLPWELRLRIATEMADALAYLHFKVNIPIIHRDVKSSNILIDNNYTAKISDFGASKMMPFDELHVTTLVQGTLGYLDPEYVQSHQLTNKSDVYSFGVVLLEIVTGKLPFSSQRSDTEKSLAAMFISYMKRNKVYELFDQRIVNKSPLIQLEYVGNLAMQCLNLRGDERPSMTDIARQLECIRGNEHHPWMSYYNPKQSSLGESSTKDSTAYYTDEQSSTLLSFC